MLDFRVTYTQTLESQKEVVVDTVGSPWNLPTPAALKPGSATIPPLLFTLNELY